MPRTEVRLPMPMAGLVALVLMLMTFPTALSAQSEMELAAEAESLASRGEHAEAAEHYLQAFERMKKEPALLYLAARSLLHNGEEGRAIELLGRALEQGMLLADPLARDTVFRSLKGEPAYTRLTERARAQEQTIDRELRKKLVELAEMDKVARTGMAAAVRRAGRDSALRDSINQVLAEKDGPIQERFRQIVAEHGWPGRSMVGHAGADAAWQLAQHADTLFQRSLLPLLEESVARGEAAPSHWAYLVDRVRMRRGKPQLFGTQFRWSDEEGRMVLHPVENPEQLDERRAKVGLGPIEEYVERMEDRFGAQPPP